MVSGHYRNMNNSLKGHNTFGIDARCREYREYSSLAELLSLCHTLQKPYLHIGQGSNLLFTKDYDGTIIHCNVRGIRLLAEEGTDVLISVGGGEIWDDVVAWCTIHGYYGTENLSLIPGEMGAAAVQNIGAYGVEVGDVIEYVDFVHLEAGEPRRLSAKECQYAYRSSIFKTSLRGECAVYSVTLRLSTIFTPHLTYGAIAERLEGQEPSAQTLRDTIIDIRNSKLPDPKTLGNAGSYFMNPIISDASFKRLISLYPDMPHYRLGDDEVKVPAGWLIEQCGWKGRTLGRAGVYEKQALVLVNLGEATGADILRLQEAIQEDVKKKYGITILPEVNAI